LECSPADGTSAAAEVRGFRHVPPRRQFWRKATSIWQSPGRGQCLLPADIVAKRFFASERATLIQDQTPMRNADSKIHSSRFDSCASFAAKLLLADFCNNIGTFLTS
jgi:hypothetical protein